jgi:hypothetical protein
MIDDMDFMVSLSGSFHKPAGGIEFRLSGKDSYLHVFLRGLRVSG